jgi:membrane associated rhomboid family serine protease
MNYRRNTFSLTPPIVKNLLIINGLFFLATITLVSRGIDLTTLLGLHYVKSDLFRPFQIITHMFMHGSFMHIFFNMYALWMFGRMLEQVWGSQRFLIYYFITGLGAAFLHLLVMHFQIVNLIAEMPAQKVSIVLNQGAQVIAQAANYTDPQMAELNMLYNGTTVGASRAVFGLLLAFGMIFPNVELFIMFIPFPIKAKYFVMIFGLWIGFGLLMFIGANYLPFLRGF